MQFPEGSKEKVVVGIRLDNIFYRMDEDFGEEAVSKFVEAFVGGSLQVRSRHAYDTVRLRTVTSEADGPPIRLFDG